MRTAKKRTANEQAFGNEDANVQTSETLLTVVKEEAGQQAEEQQQPEQQEPETKAEVKPLTVVEKLAALKELDKIAEQRSNLITMIDNLKGFVIEVSQAAELDQNEPYRTCELSIKDDKGRAFSTKNTVLIAATVGHLLSKSETRLEELESLLVFPAAA